MTPEMYQQAQQAQREAQAIEMAKLSPFQQGIANTYMGVGNLVQNVGGALGGQDPMLKQITAVRDVMKGVNPNDPRSLMQAAQQLASVAPQQAAQLAQQARAANEQLAKTSSEGITGQLLRTGKYVPESVATFEKTGTGLELIDATSKPSDEWLSVAREMGLKAGRSFNDYSPEQVGAVNLKLFNQSIQKGQATRPTTIFQQESAFSKARGEQQAKAVEAASSDARAAALSLDRLGEMKRLAADPKLYTGPQANAAVAATNLLQGFGLVSPEQARQLANGEMYQKYANDVTFQELNGKLGGNVSNNDVEFIKSRLPQLTTSSKARMELINKLEEIQKGKIAYYEKMNAHANKYNNLNDFKFAEPTNKTVKWSDLP